MTDRNKLKPRRSYTINSVPLVSDLEENEMAVNWTDGKVFVRRNNAIITLTMGGSGGGGGGSGSSSLVYAATPASFPATGSADNLYIATESQRIYRWATSVYVECGPVGGGLSWGSAPTLPNSTGSAGDLAWDGSYLYLATGTNAWRRVSLPAWDVPTEIPGLQLWLDASYAPSLYDATAGGSLVAADGAVARWEDRSGNGRHATQSTSGSRPLRKTAVQGGKDVLRFDGSNDVLSVANSTGAFNSVHQSGSTVFLVCKPSQSSDPNSLGVLMSNELSNAGSSNTGFTIAVDDRAASSRNNGLFLLVSNRPSDNGDLRYGYVQTGVFSAANQFAVVSFRGDMTQATGANRGVTRINGGSPVSVSPIFGDDGAINSSAASYDLKLGAAGGGNGFFSDADIGEVIVYDSALSDTDRSAIEQYLISKWGIS